MVPGSSVRGPIMMIAQTTHDASDGNRRELSTGSTRVRYVIIRSSCPCKLGFTSVSRPMNGQLQSPMCPKIQVPAAEGVKLSAAGD
jgi:hypothetical protein